jgi:hypothetical protein
MLQRDGWDITKRGDILEKNALYKAIMEFRNWSPYVLGYVVVRSIFGPQSAA